MKSLAWFAALASLVPFRPSVTFASEAPAPVECTIENPCAWTRPEAPGKRPVLNYCLKTLRGDVRRLELGLEDPSGRPIGVRVLNVRTFDRKKLIAASADGKFSLNADAFGDGYSGGITVKPEKVGLFLYCEKTSGR